MKVTRQGVRVLRPTRPAGSIVDLAERNEVHPTRDDDLNFTLARSAGNLTMTCGFWHDRQQDPPQSAGRTKTVVVVTDGVIHRREELANIGLEHIAESPGKLLATVHRSVGSFSLATGIRIGNESRLGDRFQHAGQRMMHNAVTVGCGTDEPLLWLVDVKRTIVAGTIGLGEQMLSQLPEFSFEVELVTGDGGAKPLAPFRLPGGSQQMLETSQRRPEVALAFQGWLFGV